MTFEKSVISVFEAPLSIISPVGMSKTIAPLQLIFSLVVITISKLKVSFISSKLTPKFDKQTINYTIDAKVGDIVNIEATAEDSRAEVLGTGKVKIIDDKEPIEITVKAENGIERTYFIDTSNGKNTSSNSITNEEVKEYNAETTSKSVEMKENEKNNLIIIIVIAIVVLLLLFVAFPKKKKKSKRR